MDTRYVLMKSSAFAATGLLVFSGCTFEEKEVQSLNPPKLAQDAIAFHSSAFKVASKTPVIDGNNISTFKVSANLPYPSDPGQTILGKHGFNFIDGLNVLRRAESWGYAPSIYWPNDSDEISFYAYSPAGSVNLEDFYSGMLALPSKDTAQISYTVPTDPGPTVGGSGANGAKLPEDLLVAFSKRRKLDGDTVLLNFRHALSIVTFAARNTTQDLDVTLQKVQIIRLKTTGTLDLSQNFNQDNVYWNTSADAVPQDYTAGIPLQDDGSYAISLPPQGPQSNYLSISGPSEGMPVMPQGFKVDGGNPQAYTKPFVLDDSSAPEPNQPGILVTYMAKSSVQLVAPSGTRAFYPFSKLYHSPNYSGLPDLEGNNPSDDAFAFQMGKRYQFRFDFDGSAYPRIDFQTGNIDDFQTDSVIESVPTIALTGNAFSLVGNRKYMKVGNQRQTSIAGPDVKTNQRSWAGEVRQGDGWLTLNTLFGRNGELLKFTVSENKDSLSSNRNGYIVVYTSDPTVTDTLFVTQGNK
ncbi:MAG: fimbrillin family protein [Tannerella sp.]|jgi:hypothetical protein|nr:fimbrillin family protein [Tannerella sp.]